MKYQKMTKRIVRPSKGKENSIFERIHNTRIHQNKYCSSRARLSPG